LSKKKILVFVDWYIPAFKAGGPIRSVMNLVERLADEYDFYIITGDRDLGEDKAIPNLELNEWCQVEKAKVIYLSPENHKLKNFKELIIEIDPQFIYLNSLFSFNFTLLPLWLNKRFPKIKFILAPRGMLGRGALEIKKKKKEVFIGLARLIKLYKGIVWHATNEKEKSEIESTFGSNHEVVIADNIASAPQFSFQEILEFKTMDFERKRFLFVSRIYRKKNVEKLIEWFLYVASERSNFQLDIIGTIEDQEYYNELKLMIDKSPNIRIESAIPPSELAIIFAKAHFFCLPTRHENYGHAIIEALSYACPVIISQRTPWRNLEKEQIGWDLPLDKPEMFISAFKECIDMDENQYLQMSERASLYAYDHIHRTDIKIAYRKLFS
jgi:glycosyltransferase involved in cell wall biosynthesis